jgi:fimbrial chaperone protein
MKRAELRRYYSVAMDRRSFLRTLAGAAVAGSGVTLSSRARAFSLKVTPIPIVISGGATSTMVEIENQGPDPLRVQTQVFDWTQTPTGDDKLDPSGELLVFPSMATIPPNSTRKVRVGTQGGYGTNEKSFRIIFAELPPDSTPINGPDELVKVVAHVSVPIFVKPPGVAAALKIEGLSATKDRVRFGVRNTGNEHALVEKVRVELLAAGGQVVGSTDVAGWYILPGLVRPFDVDVKNLCSGAKTLHVTALSLVSGTASASLDKPACG